MPVTVDHQPLPTDSLGLTTVGQVLAHLQRQDRLVVNVLIDGAEPDLNQLPTIRQSALNGHTIFIETAEPREMAIDVLDEVERQLDEADRLKTDAVDLIQSNQNVKAMEKLGGCFRRWQHVQESVSKTGRLLRIDLSRIVVNGQSLDALMSEFGNQLRTIKSALENRDFVSLCDTLTYETSETVERWRAAVESMRETVE